MARPTRTKECGVVVLLLKECDVVPTTLIYRQAVKTVSKGVCSREDLARSCLNERVDMYPKCFLSVKNKMPY